MKSKNPGVALLVLLTAYTWTGCSIDAQGNRVIGGPGFGEARLYEKPSSAIEIKDRSDVINRYLARKELAPIEGVWVMDSNHYEVAIIRNNTEIYKEYDYVGVVTDTRVDSWARGQIKMLLKETASPHAYSGAYFDAGHNELGTMFLLSSKNLIEFSVPDQYGNQHRTMLVRNFPKESQPQRITDAETSSGTGFFVAQDVVATNYHVVREAKQISLSVGGTSMQADLLLKDAQNDLALLRINSANLPTTVVALKGVKCLAIGNSDGARSGDAVFTIGFPLSGFLATTPSVAQGLISNASGVDDDPRMFQISIPIQAGNSGSPLFDSKGRVIGVVTSTLNSKAMLKATGTLPQNVNFATKSSYLRSILSMAPSSDCAESGLLKQSLTARDMQDHYASSIVPIRVSR
ncbi:MAG: trypsin-like peptidase domain-containing protein [Nitrospira sp. CG24E]|nr:MAG: trypsin-like peptidase domain-containing protein [Nitrospira sp. CG24E]